MNFKKWFWVLENSHSEDAVGDFPSLEQELQSKVVARVEVETVGSLLDFGACLIQYYLFDDRSYS